MTKQADALSACFSMKKRFVIASAYGPWYNNCESSYYTNFIAIFLPGFAGNRKI